MATKGELLKMLEGYEDNDVVEIEHALKIRSVSKTKNIADNTQVIEQAVADEVGD